LYPIVTLILVLLGLTLSTIFASVSQKPSKLTKRRFIGLKIIFNTGHSTRIEIKPGMEK